MQAIHITCIPERLLLLVEELDAQLQTLDGVELLDWGHSCKKGQGYIVLEWLDEVGEAFVEQLHGDESVVDYCLYTIPQPDALPFGDEPAMTVAKEDKDGQSSPQ